MVGLQQREIETRKTIVTLLLLSSSTVMAAEPYYPTEGVQGGGESTISLHRQPAPPTIRQSDALNELQRDVPDLLSATDRRGASKK